MSITASRYNKTYKNNNCQVSCKSKLAAYLQAMRKPQLSFSFDQNQTKRSSLAAIYLWGHLIDCVFLANTICFSRSYLTTKHFVVSPSTNVFTLNRFVTGLLCAKYRTFFCSVGIFNK
jgi:hypothetical protein